MISYRINSYLNQSSFFKGDSMREKIIKVYNLYDTLINLKSISVDSDRWIQEYIEKFTALKGFDTNHPGYSIMCEYLVNAIKQELDHITSCNFKKMCPDHFNTKIPARNISNVLQSYFSKKCHEEILLNGHNITLRNAHNLNHLLQEIKMEMT